MTEVELTAYERQRVEWFAELGFDGFQSLALATARDSAGHLVTVHDVRRALENGCDLATAFRIFA